MRAPVFWTSIGCWRGLWVNAKVVIPIIFQKCINFAAPKDLFHEKLHSYLITDAIKDENVLKFAVEYVGFSTLDTKNFYGYYKDIGKKVKAGEVDILLVVNMFLTGFGNILMFRNLKARTDEAIALFSNVKALEEIFLLHGQRAVA